MPPSAAIAEPAPAESTEEEFSSKGRDAEWDGAVRALEAYGVFRADKLCERAGGRGWTAEQVLDLVRQCCAKTIGRVRAWGAGLVYRHLQNAVAGVPIGMPPCEEYVRAKRDHELALAEMRRADAAAREAEAAAVRGAEVDRLNEQLHALPEQERLELAEAVVSASPFLRKVLARGGGADVLLSAMRSELARREESSKPFSTE